MARGIHFVVKISHVTHKLRSRGILCISYTYIYGTIHWLWVTWLILTLKCDMPTFFCDRPFHSYVNMNQAKIIAWHAAMYCVRCRIHMCDMNHSCAWCNSVFCVTWFIHMPIYMRTHVYIHIYTRIHTHTHTRTYVNAQTHTYTYIYTYTYTYTYTHVDSRSTRTVFSRE